MLLGGMDGCIQSTSMIEYAASAALRKHLKLDLPPQGTASMRMHEPLVAIEMRTKGENRTNREECSRFADLRLSALLLFRILNSQAGHAVDGCSSSKVGQGSIVVQVNGSYKQAGSTENTVKSAG